MDDAAIDAACEAWKRATDLLFTRRDKVICVVEAYLEHANKHTLPDTFDPQAQRKINAVLKDEIDALSTQNTGEK